MALPDQPSPPDHLENHLIWVDLTKMAPLGLKQNVPWMHSRNLQSLGYSHDTIIVITKLDLCCTGAVGIKQHSCRGVLWVFKRPQVSPLEKQRNWQHDIWCLMTNTWANRIVIVSSIITRYLTLTNIGRPRFNLQIWLCSVNQFNHICFQFSCYCLSVVRFSCIQFCSVVWSAVIRLFSVW
jgi:hypothetical protein